MVTLHRSVRVFAIAAALGVWAGPGQTAITVLGTGAARSCFVAASLSRATQQEIQTCTHALEQENLSQRDHAATLNNRGILLQLSNNPQAAMRDYDRAMKVMPDLGEIYVNRGAILARMERDKEAIASISRGLELGTGMPQVAHYTRGMIYELQGDVRAAYNDYRKAAELAPDWAAPREQLLRFRVVPASATDAPVPRQDKSGGVAN
jgi:tetratricopeptide (TPR) repeat protein